MRIKLSFFLYLLGFLAGNAFAQGNRPLPKLDKTLSVVVHIVLDEMGNTKVLESDIQAAFDLLNTNFEKIALSFEICAFDSVPNFQYDSLLFDEEKNELSIKYDVKNRINMYFIDADEEKPSVCGKATLNGINNPGAIWMLKRCIDPGNNTMSHEVGHFLGLEHTFTNPNSQLVNNANCATTGDEICDTPADPYVDGEPIGEYIKNCRFISEKKDANGDFYDPLMSNIMSYYVGCTCDFTNDQYRKMAKNYLNSIPNNW